MGRSHCLTGELPGESGRDGIPIHPPLGGLVPGHNLQAAEMGWHPGSLAAGWWVAWLPTAAHVLSQLPLPLVPMVSMGHGILAAARGLLSGLDTVTGKAHPFSCRLLPQGMFINLWDSWPPAGPPSWLCLLGVTHPRAPSVAAWSCSSPVSSTCPGPVPVLTYRGLPGSRAALCG